MKKIKVILSMVAFLVGAASLSAQNLTIKGTVRDASTQEGVPSAVVHVRGTSIGVSADANGVYTLSAPSNATLTVSSIGYVTEEVAVNGRAQIDIVLTPDDQLLDETIVVAYGTATKQSFTGSAAMVKEEAIAAHVTSNAVTALAGTTPGVQVIMSSGDPTSDGTAIRIRGIGSMTASSAPLYILDGMPYDGSLNDINPNDIESLSVLKDAAASAIYGARGANGVVLITTKRAKNSEARVTVDAKWGSNSRLIPQYDVISDPAQYYEFFYKLLYNSQSYLGKSDWESHKFANDNLFNERNGGLGYKVFTVPEGESLIGKNFKINPHATYGYSDGEYTYLPDNWYDETFHNSFRHEYNVTVSGSKDKFSYYASFGYLNDGGIVNNSNYSRLTARVNTDYQVRKWLKLVANIAYSHSDSQSPSYDDSTWGSSGNTFYIANTIGPIYPLYVRDAEGNIMKNPLGNKVYDAGQTNFSRPSIVGNAIRDNEYDRSRQYGDVINGKVGFVASICKGLDLNANVSLLNSNYRYNYLGSPFGSSSSTDGYASASHTRYFNVNAQALLTYKTDFRGSDHHFDALAGFEMYNQMTQGIGAASTNLYDPFIGEVNNADSKSNRRVSSSTSRYMTEGFLARVQYDYAGRYFISGSYRRDASSRFAKGHRWGDFGSVGAAWVLSEENWLKGVNNVEFLKLKVSYGIQGNDALGNAFPYSDQYTHSYNEDTKEYSLTLSFKGNENITWETSHAINVGFDFGFFKGKLNGTVEYFNRITSDLLYSKRTPLSAGNPTGYYPVNVGSIDNQGVEVTLDGNIFNRRNVRWDWNLNLSHYTNKILSLDPAVMAQGGDKGGYFIRKVGGSLYQTYLVKYAGVNEEGKATYYYDDADGKMVTTTDITKANQYDCGTTLPKLFGGFGTTLKLFGFDLSAQFAFQLGGKYYDSEYQHLMLTLNSAGNNVHKDMLKAWSPENTGSNIPRLDGDYTAGQTAIDRFLVSSNYFSVNNVTVGYTFPEKWMRKAKIAALRIYFSGENLAVATARKGLDPRNGFGIGSYTYGSGLSSSSYAGTRNITGGISITF